MILVVGVVQALVWSRGEGATGQLRTALTWFLVLAFLVAVLLYVVLRHVELAIVGGFHTLSDSDFAICKRLIATVLDEDREDFERIWCDAGLDTSPELRMNVAAVALGMIFWPLPLRAMPRGSPTAIERADLVMNCARSSAWTDLLDETVAGAWLAQLTRVKDDDMPSEAMWLRSDTTYAATQILIASYLLAEVWQPDQVDWKKKYDQNIRFVRWSMQLTNLERNEARRRTAGL